jgi:hypothetical protein
MNWRLALEDCSEIEPAHDKERGRKDATPFPIFIEGTFIQGALEVLAKAKCFRIEEGSPSLRGQLSPAYQYLLTLISPMGVTG